MKPLLNLIIPKNTGKAFIVKKGQLVRIEGKSVVDFVAFNLNNLKERFDQARTKSNQAKIFISTGDHLFSKFNNVIMTIVEDTFREGRHDLQKGMCNRKRFEMVAKGLAKRDYIGDIDPNPKILENLPDHGCWENLTAALEPWNIPPEDIPSPFNIFQTMIIDPETGRMFDTFIRPKDKAHIDFRAELDCLVAVSACPESGRGQSINVIVYDP
ncbi:urea carboxylase-associated family protein [Candidatus Bathyarchaeota archaeon]|nr:urea carboxylase-associated family protein [Candidatus Bathyarchaeota archaeon]